VCVLVAAVYYNPSGPSADDADGVKQERNVILHRGWFDNSVPPFLAGLPKGENGEPLPCVACSHAASVADSNVSSY
jgi:hypothetical protein